jgi:DNA/RNA endonuclease YhcR with UshA esterase domain
MKIITLALTSFLFIGAYQAQVNNDKGNHSLPKDKIENDTIKNKEGGHYYFTVVKDIESLDVQSQGRTGTC